MESLMNRFGGDFQLQLVSGGGSAAINQQW